MMILFLVLEVAGGTYIYNQQEEFQENIQKSISKVVEKSYGNDRSVTVKMDAIQAEVGHLIRLLRSKFIFNIFKYYA